MTDLILNHDGNDNYNLTLQNVTLTGAFIITITSPHNYYLNSKRYFIYKNVDNINENGNIHTLKPSYSYNSINSINLNCEWLANSKPNLYGTFIFKENKYNLIDKSKIKAKVVITEITKKDKEWNAAAKSGYIEILKYLSTNKIGNCTESTMKTACTNKNFEIVATLI